MIMYKRSLRTLLFIIIFVVIASSAFAESRYIRKQNENSGVIVFVHGVLGGATATWTNETTKAFWPHLIRDDATFAGFNIYLYEYPSTLAKANYSIDELAEDMRSSFSIDRIYSHARIVFIVHSMGGLVTRRISSNIEMWRKKWTSYTSLQLPQLAVLSLHWVQS